MTTQVFDDVCVVTGGAHGIGRAAALRLARDGACVAVWDINQQGAEETCAELERGGARALALAVDVADTNSVEQAARRTRAELGPVGVLVNNVGIATPGLLWETSDEDWERVLSINLTGQFRCTRALVPAMIERRHGSIVNVGSISALIGRREASAAYSASKGGVISLTYLLAAQAGEYNVRANAVCPGTILTGIHSSFAPEQLHGLLSTVLLHRAETGQNAGAAEDVAEAIYFLASPASSWVTGTVMIVSGGQLLR